MQYPKGIAVGETVFVEAKVDAGKYSRHRLIRRPQNTEILSRSSDMMN